MPWRMDRWWGMWEGVKAVVVVRRVVSAMEKVDGFIV
jgi:hypothetical protein